MVKTKELEKPRVVQQKRQKRKTAVPFYTAVMALDKNNRNQDRRIDLRYFPKS